MSDELIGQRYGKLTVLSRSFYNRSNGYAECLCDCGNTKIVRIDNLKRGTTASCGCAHSRMNSPHLNTDSLPSGNRNRRNVLIQERGAMCEVCGFDCEPALEVHHVIRVVDGGTHDRPNLVLLCANCHAMAEHFRGNGRWQLKRRQDFTQYTNEQFDRLLECLPPMAAQLVTAPPVTTPPVDTMQLRNRLVDTIMRMAQ